MGIRREMQEAREEMQSRRRNLAWGFILAIITIVIGAFFAARCAKGQEINHDQILLATALFSGADIAPSYMAEDEDAEALGAEVTFSYESRYVDLNGEVLHDDPVGRLKYFQPLSHSNCLYLYTEVLWDGDEWGSSYGDEAGLYLGCYASADSGWFLDTGAGYVWIAKIEEEEIPDLINPYLEVGRLFDRNEEGASFSLSLVADGYHPTNNDIEGGWFIRLRTVSMLPLGERAHVRAFLETTFDEGVYGLDEAYIGLADISVLFDIGERWSAGPGFKRSWMLSGVDDYRSDESAYMFTLSYAR